ncbi:hypothetical protein CHUAL_007595 [Chamberlinius hualienensis]
MLATNLNIFFYAVVSCFALANSEGYIENLDAVVNTNQGQIQGTKFTSTCGRQANAYLGIPYGKIVKRFQEAVPASPWTGVLDATKDAPPCLQYPVQFHKPLEIFGQEDCLTLNVYTPERGSPNSPGPWAVMVWFHGGGFVEGQAAMSLYGPQRLLNKDIVLVIMNYRVGPFGFLSTGDEASPGNYGLLDQNLALRWVQENIGAFGGNPSRVTITGESAGGASVTYHILSPLSNGLFQAAIHQSGSAICPWASQPHPLEIAKNVAGDPLLNCPTENTSEMIECLRNADPIAIVNVTAKSGPAALPFTSGPVVENKINGRFITENPLTLLEQGRFNKVPVMSAVSEDEATSLFVFLGFIDGSKSYKPSEEEVNGYIAAVAGLTPKDSKKLNKITEKYFHWVDYNNPDEIRLRKIQLGSDAYFKSCTDLTAKLLATNGVPVYYYVFDFASTGTAVSNFTGKPDVGHGIILLYLFNMTIWNPSIYTDDDKIVSAKLIDYWTHFMDTEQPTDNQLEWPPTAPAPLIYMNIGLQQTLGENYEADKVKFWQDIFYNTGNDSAGE